MGGGRGEMLGDKCVLEAILERRHIILQWHYEFRLLINTFEPMHFNETYLLRYTKIGVNWYYQR
jgi:hypothetical protein